MKHIYIHTYTYTQKAQWCCIFSVVLNETCIHTYIRSYIHTHTYNRYNGAVFSVSGRMNIHTYMHTYIKIHAIGTTELYSQCLVEWTYIHAYIHTNTCNRYNGAVFSMSCRMKQGSAELPTFSSWSLRNGRIIAGPKVCMYVCAGHAQDTNICLYLCVYVSVYELGPKVC